MISAETLQNKVVKLKAGLTGKLIFIDSKKFSSNQLELMQESLSTHSEETFQTYNYVVFNKNQHWWAGHNSIPSESNAHEVTPDELFCLAPKVELPEYLKPEKTVSELEVELHSLMDFDSAFGATPGEVERSEYIQKLLQLNVQDKSKSDGTTASYYELPKGATELQDLISDKDMNAQMGEIFRAVYRYGQVSHSPKLRDAKKIRYYADMEIKRLEKLEGTYVEPKVYSKSINDYVSTYLNVIYKYYPHLTKVPEETLKDLTDMADGVINHQIHPEKFNDIVKNREGTPEIALFQALSKYIREYNIY